MHRHASLNRIFRLVWSHLHQAWVVVSETSRGRGKRASRKLLLTAAALAAAPLAQAGPTGGQVTNGTGAITQSGATTTINQSSQNLSLQWNSFNTNASETVNFVQPSSSALAVNRIVDTSATQFFGKLNANGQVWLINPNGVLFGAGSQVNVGGLVASTLDTSDQAGGTLRFSGTGAGSIVNQGAITTPDGGYVAFLGNRVSNQGNITAPAGRVALGAGSDVTLSFAGNRLLNLQVNQTTLDNLAENGGLIRADGGAVVLSAGAKDAVLASAVNNTGVIEARSVREVNGAIVLDGGQSSLVSNSGTLDASGRTAGATGGAVKVLGQDVNLAATGKIDVAGDAGGGTALVGGNFLGSGPERNAQNTTVAAGATILANAIATGNGGNVAVWSDQATQFAGSISARGGAAGGNGGQVETSGKHLTVAATGAVDTLAPRGATGDWLLDPQDITIGGYNDGESDISGKQITTALETSNVTIKTGPSVTCAGPITCAPGTAGNGDIVIVEGGFIGGTYTDDGDLHWGGNTTLTLSAYRNVDMRSLAVIDAGGGPSGSLVMRADNTGTGVGTVLIDRDAAIFGSPGGTVQIYYNPSSYATPTDYAGLTSTDGVYTVFNNANLSTYMLVNVTAPVASKTYDGTLTATLNGAPTPRAALPSGVTIDTTGAVVSFVDKNAGINKPTLITGVTLGGVNASQFALNALDSNVATISQANLAVTGVTANSRTYNASLGATLSGTATVTPIGADVVNVAGSGVGAFADKNVGVGKPVTVSGYTLAGLDAANYSIVQPTGLFASINQASLAVTGVSAATKTYDGTTAATLAGTAAVTGFSGDVVNVTGTGSASFVDKNAGINKPVTISGYTLGGADAGNYSIVQPAGVTATINQASLAVSGIGAFDKTYDATTTATLFGSATVTGIGADDVSVGGTGAGVFADKNAGAGKAVTVTGYTLGGADAGNYSLVQPTGLTAAIGKAALALTGLTANNKTYDGTTAATLAGSATVAPLGSDVVSVAGSGAGTFADKNAGLGKAVTVSGFALSGADANNYNLILPAGLAADIARANLAITGVTAIGKTYDGTVTASLGGAATVAAFGSDAVSVAGAGTGVFADKNAGANKGVTVTGFALAGADADNYNAVQPAGLSATIGQAGLTIGGLTASDKVYDGTTAATLAGTATVTPIGSDAVGLSGSGSGAFADKNAGAAKAVTVTGYTLTGPDAANYTVAQPAGLTATINRADLALTGIAANNKTYDGTAAASLSGAASVTPIGADVVNVAGSGTGAFADKNAGPGKAVTVAGYTLAGLDAANYNLVLPAGLTADIARANLAVTGVTANSKVYDGTTAATLGGAATVAAFGSDVVSVDGSGAGAFADKNVGANKAVTVTGFTLGGLDANNYNILQPSELSASISQAALAIVGLAAADKVYDGTRAATLTGTATVSPYGADIVGVAGTGAGNFADKNVGIGKTVAVTGYTLTGADAGNYTVAQPTGVTASISQANLALSGLTASSKIYDGTTAATLAGTPAVTGFEGDVVSVSGTGTGIFADKNAGLGKAVTVGGYTLAGADAGNYNLVTPSALTADISRANLAVTGVLANDKTYDGTTAATLGGNAAVAAFGSDDVLVAGTGAGVFADKNAGADKAVTASGFTLTGRDADNYIVTQPAGLAATINRANLAIGGVAASDKLYDGTVAATLSGTATVSAFGSDVVGVTGQGSAAFADKNAGAGKPVLVSGYTLTGEDAANYTLAQPSGLTASIAQRGLALTGLTASNKIYDGTTAATLTGSASVAAIEGDAVSVTGNGTGTFADKNAGAGKAVTATGYTLAGADAGNYVILQPESLRADIGRASLAVSGITASNKTYDGGTSATLAGAATVNAFGSDVVSVTGPGAGAFADKNVGQSKAVTVTGFTLAGVDAGNYDLVQPVGVTANIGKAQLAVTGITASNKVYDGTTAATLAGTAAVTPFGSDAVTLAGAGTATFADKNVGAGKLVAIGGYTLAGADAGNYDVVAPASLRAAITPAPLTVSGITASDKQFDGTTAATVSTSGVNLGGKLGADSVTVSSTGAFADAAAGAAKTVNLTNTYGGADAANYAIADQATTSATIAPLPQAPVIPEVREAVAQVQSTILAPQASTQPGSLNLSSTLVDVAAGASTPPADDDKTGDRAASGLINVRFGAGPGAPTLQIQSGGIQLPPLANNSAE
jgi:filamentous hemagglutinin family protein